MQIAENEITILILVTGLILVSTAFIKLVLERITLPSVVGFILFGLGINFVNSRLNFLTPGSMEVLHFLSSVGIICLLFRAGLECDLKGLLKQLRRASIIWLFDMCISGLLGFAATRFLLGYPLVPSLIIGAALTATSVGVSLAVWQQQDATDSDNGRLLLDIAELDDISAVILMAMLFSLIPILTGGQPDGLLPVLTRNSLLFGVKLFGFIALCYYFATFGEQLGGGLLPPELFSGMALVTIMTCVLTPLTVKPLPQRWPQKNT